MFSTDDTIVAIATPPGRGGLGVVRISGPEALRCARELTGRDDFRPRHATLVRISSKDTFDRAVVTWFQAPASYTGEDVIEISAHGSPVLLQSIVKSAMDAGARLAQPGEFTFRAYLSSRIDLVQAEAVNDLINAVTPLQVRSAFDQLEGTLTERIRRIDGELFDLATALEASLDFPEEGYHFVEPGAAATSIAAVRDSIRRLLESAKAGRLVREGAQVVIVGRPNVGKSTLFNALVGAGRAIVTDIPGTTRDLLTERAEVEGIPVTFVDTAGLRLDAADAVETEGVSRAARAAQVADLVLVVVDASVGILPQDQMAIETNGAFTRITVANKSDLPRSPLSLAIPEGVLLVSAASGDGLDRLRSAIAASLGADQLRDAPAITNLRHVDLLVRAADALDRAEAAAANATPEEFVLADIHEARTLLEEVTGKRTADDTLNAIFSTFCIGK
jgi:tRNA modification GTPase